MREEILRRIRAMKDKAMRCDGDGLSVRWEFYRPDEWGQREGCAIENPTINDIIRIVEESPHPASWVVELHIGMWETQEERAQRDAAYEQLRMRE